MGIEPGSRREDYPAEMEPFAAFVEEKIRAGGVPGLSIAVVKGDRVAWARGFGLAWE